MRFNAPENLPFTLTQQDFQWILGSLLEELRAKRPETDTDPQVLPPHGEHEPGSLANQWLQKYDPRHLPQLLESGLRNDLNMHLKTDHRAIR